MLAPGIHEGVEFDTYLADDALSFSDMETWLAGKPKSLGRIGTRGSLAHCIVLEGKAATRARYAIISQPPADAPATAIDRYGDWKLSSREGKAAFAEIEATGKVPVKSSEWASVRGMCEGIKRCKRAQALLSLPSQREVTILAHLPRLPISSECANPLEGPRFKTLTRCRLDMLLDGDAVDLKTTHHANHDMFIDSIVTFNYAARAAFYTDMVWAARSRYPRWWWLCVATAPPYDAWVEELTNEQMAFGRKQYQWLLRCYEGCQELKPEKEADDGADA